jgi:hypothetical protein
MIPDFNGHHFLEDSKPGEPPSTHHCQLCGLKAALKPDGSVFFDLERRGIILQPSNTMIFKTSRIPRCKH